jgi:hypothetical protein
VKNPLAPQRRVAALDALPGDHPTPLAPPEPPYVTGGPPYPQRPTDDGRYGLSILDWFAAHVITGLAMRADTTVDDLKTSGAQDAYWIAAQMVQLRSDLPIESTPVPTPPPEESGPPVVIPPDNLP